MHPKHRQRLFDGMAYMNDREFFTAALRWHSARTARLLAGAEQRRYQQQQKQLTGFGGSDLELSRRLTAAKRIEQAALRQLAALCAQARGGLQSATDADVIDVPIRITHCAPFAQEGQPLPAAID